MKRCSPYLLTKKYFVIIIELQNIFINGDVMRDEYDFSKLNPRKNPYAKILNAQKERQEKQSEDAKNKDEKKPPKQ